MKLLLLLLAATAYAQTALNGGLHVHLHDPQERPVAGAVVTLASPRLTTPLKAVSDATGHALFLRLEPGADWSVRAAAPGFQDWTRDGVTISSGETVTLEADLALAARTDAITVGEESTKLEGNEISTTIARRELDALPTNGRFVNRFALLNAHVRNTAGLGADASNLTRLSVNGQIFRETQYRLDGNTNYDTLFNNAPLQRVGLSAVQEFRVLTNQFNAEHGSTSTGLVITTTKSGTDSYHGEAFFQARPSGIQARPPLAALRIPNQLLQPGAALGGPLAKNRTYFFGSYEHLAQDRGSFIQSPTPGFFLGRYRDHLGLVRLDQRFKDTHWLSLRVNGHRDDSNNANDRVGGLIQASAAVRNNTQAIGTQLTDTIVMGRAVNELRLGYTNAVPSSGVPVTPAPVVVRPGVSTEGNATFSSYRNEVYQAADQFSIQIGTHSLKMGGDFIRRKVRELTFDQFGTSTLNPAGDVIQFTQRLGVARLSYGQTQWAGFLQDSWKVSHEFTVNLGMRFDYQSLLDDRNNFGPRAGFAWNPRGGSTVLRGGFGVNYDQPFFHGLTQRFLLNAPDAPFRTITLAGDTPSRNLVLRGNRLLAPYTTQFTFGLQQKLWGGWTVEADVIRSLTVKQITHHNLNAPAPFARPGFAASRTVAEADRTRPFGVFQGVNVRDVRLAVNGGVANYHALDARVSKRYARGLFRAHYVWSSSINSVTDDHLGANPQDWSDVIRGERGVSDFLQRHRFTAYATHALPFGFQMAATAIAGSGLPVNAVTGVDTNGDTVLTDRPFGIGRNAFRGTAHRSVDVSLARPVTLSEHVRLELRVDTFNVFNNVNLYRFNNVWGTGPAPRATFLQPIGGIANVDPGRQFTVGAKLVF